NREAPRSPPLKVFADNVSRRGSCRRASYGALRTTLPATPCVRRRLRRRRPQDGHTTPAGNQPQRSGETKEKRIQGLHSIDLLSCLTTIACISSAHRAV